MALPLFYVPQLEGATAVIDEDTSKHMIGVLRMQKGEDVLLTNGKGQQATARIINDNRKRCEVAITTFTTFPPPSPSVTIAISLLKNAARFEWFLEKATEIGVREIIPVLCARTEKEKFRSDRLRQILISAMLQSQQTWLPQLHEPTKFEDLLRLASQDQKYIAHCMDGEKQTISEKAEGSSIILIGPEGDFTPEEVRMALQEQFLPVMLGTTRLRTETAGMVAATLLRLR